MVISKIIVTLAIMYMAGTTFIIAALFTAIAARKRQIKEADIFLRRK